MLFEAAPFLFEYFPLPLLDNSPRKVVYYMQKIMRYRFVKANEIGEVMYEKNVGD